MESGNASALVHAITPSAKLELGVPIEINLSGRSSGSSAGRYIVIIWSVILGIVLFLAFFHDDE